MIKLNTSLKDKLKDDMIREFEANGFASDSYYPTESNLDSIEYMNFLDMNGGVKIEREVATQIFDRVPKNRSGNMSPLDFIEVYLEAFLTLTQKICEIDREYNELEKERSVAVDKLRNAKIKDAEKGEESNIMY